MIGLLFQRRARAVFFETAFIHWWDLTNTHRKYSIDWMGTSLFCAQKERSMEITEAILFGKERIEWNGLSN